MSNSSYSFNAASRKAPADSYTYGNYFPFEESTQSTLRKRRFTSEVPLKKHGVASEKIDVPTRSCECECGGDCPFGNCGW